MLRANMASRRTALSARHMCMHHYYNKESVVQTKTRDKRVFAPRVAPLAANGRHCFLSARMEITVSMGVAHD